MRLNIFLKQGDKMTLIIADDSADFRERIRNLAMKYKNLQIAGESANGAEALQLIHQTEADMIILDIRMPVMNGIQVLRKLKEQGNKAIVCILTSYDYPQYKKKCMELGARYLFNKWDDFKKLGHAIESVIKEVEGRNLTCEILKNPVYTETEHTP